MPERGQFKHQLVESIAVKELMEFFTIILLINLVDIPAIILEIIEEGKKTGFKRSY